MDYFIQIYQSQRFPNMLVFINQRFIENLNVTADCGVTGPRQAYLRAEKRQEQASKHIRFTDTVKERVDQYLKEDWSPEQISGYLCEREKIHISHETIYQYIWANKRAGGTLFKHLRWSRPNPKSSQHRPVS